MHVGQLIGGLDIYIRNSIAYSDNEKFEFVVIHGKYDKSMPVYCGKSQVKEYLVDLRRSISPANDLKCLWQVFRLVKAEKPDLIHCHSAKGGFIGRIVGFLCGVKTFYTPHAFSFLSSPSKAKRFFFLSLERFTRFDTYLLACSESERQMGMSTVGYREKHALVWHNSVPDASIHKGTAGVKDENFISYIGRPCYQKNPFFLLDVIKEVTKCIPSLKFYLLGVGYHSPDLDKMKQMIEEYGIGDNIVLKPWLNHEDCLEYVRKSVFYLTCSLYEGLPLSVIEAMSLGKAVIASDVVGNRDCVLHGDNGYLVPLDVKQFAGSIIELAENTELRNTMGGKSRICFEKKFMIDRQIHKLHDLYEERTKSK